MSTPASGLRGSLIFQGFIFFIVFTVLSTLVWMLLGNAFTLGLLIQQAIMGVIAAVLWTIVMGAMRKKRGSSA